VARPAARQMSFADLELLRQGVRLEPLLQAICDFLDKQPALVERVRRDRVRGADCAATPFPGKPDRGKVCLEGGFDTNHIYEPSTRQRTPPLQVSGLRPHAI
jgi:hypothetical protein